MKHASLLSFLLIIATSASATPEPGLPTSVCSETFCGPQQDRIWNRFLSSSGLDYELSPGVYSGVCFHNSPILNGNRTHHGGILIESAEGVMFFDGRFSFFTESNPYLHLSVDNARNGFGRKVHPAYELKIKRTFAFLELVDEFVSRRYWFRQDRINDRLLLVGYFGPLHTILCDLRRNV